MSDEIPFHIQEEIIKKLPVVSLLQFRSVSKAWKSLIDSSEFIAAHSVTQPRHLLFSSVYPVKISVKYVCVVDDETFPHQQRFVHTLPLSIKHLKQAVLVGISHGLLCFHGYLREREDYLPIFETGTVALWNPSIRKSLTVPVPNNSNLDHKTELGFGVCPVSGDPKIVQIIQYRETNYHCEAKVYNVSYDKWTSLSTNLPSKPFRVFWPQVVVDRFIYWYASDRMIMDNGLPNHNNRIMSFDITNENFGAIDLPDSLRRNPSQLRISKLKESIVMLGYDSVQRACGVWMMGNGVENSFTKLFTVEAPDLSKKIRILGFSNSGQPLMEVDNGNEFFKQSQLVVYEPNSERFNDFEIYGTTRVFSVDSYMETLVLLGRSDFNSY